MTTWTHSPNEESSAWDFSSPSSLSGTISQLCRDGSGNNYPTVVIGNQEWMSENLKTTKYNDGTAITFVDDEAAEANVWEDLTTGAYSRGGPDGTAADDNFEDTYGFLYNWYAVDTGNLAPDGWRVPTETDWTTLESFINNAAYDGGYLKETGTTHWDSPNSGADDRYGFTALGTGFRSGSTGNYSYLGTRSYMWASTSNTTSTAYYRLLGSSVSYMSGGGASKDHGITVRCVRDLIPPWSSVYSELKWHTWGNETTDVWKVWG